MLLGCPKKELSSGECREFSVAQEILLLGVPEQPKVTTILLVNNWLLVYPIYLVGGFNPSWNIFVSWDYCSQYGKIKLVPNHQSDIYVYIVVIQWSGCVLQYCWEWSPRIWTNQRFTSGDAWETLAGDLSEDPMGWDPMCSELYHLVMTNIAMENPNHKWRFLDGNIIYKWVIFWLDASPWICISVGSWGAKSSVQIINEWWIRSIAMFDY